MQAVSDKISILSVNRGRSQTSVFKGKEAKSAIYKNPAERAVQLGYEGIEGDEQADRVHHGGPDKAVCVYSHVNYPHWEQVLGLQLPYGAFGENFTLGTSTETDVCIGDVFRAGTAVVQISQPRVPCWKLAMKWGLDALPKLVTDSGATGFYLRVLQPGSVQAGDELVREERHPAQVTVAEVNRILHRDKQDIAGIDRLLQLDDVLAPVLLDMLENRLVRLQTGE